MIYLLLGEKNICSPYFNPLATLQCQWDMSRNDVKSIWMKANFNLLAPCFLFGNNCEDQCRDDIFTRHRCLGSLGHPLEAVLEICPDSSKISMSFQKVGIYLWRHWDLGVIHVSPSSWDTTVLDQLLQSIFIL